MIRKILLSFIITGFFVGADAQKKQERTTAYAITGMQKGSDKWTEVRLVDLQTGEEVQSVFQSSQDIPVLNARTGKPIVKKEEAARVQPAQTTEYRITDDNDKKKVIIIRRSEKESITIISNSSEVNGFGPRRVMVYNNPVQTDKPFATSSAACAYDKKHDRLYYTPMGINQLRYIDLKGKEPKAFYFEDEPFGVLAHRHDVPNQITRMVIAADGNGYAITNNAEHLIRFTTNKRAEITDLGAITDDPANGENSLRRGGYGGDVVADDKNNLILITANRHVFRISIKDKVATWLGAIQGLPRGYSTNGAVVEKGTSIIVGSSTTTMGFYRFDLNDLQAQKLSSSESVFKASDLANANLVSDKKKEEEQPATQETARTSNPLEGNRELNVKYKMGAYPNPAVKGGVINLTFNDFPYGRYQVQLMDLSGKLLNAENINVGQRMQLHLLQLPKSLSQGTYLVKVVGDANKDKVLVTEQVVVQ
ncbi:T9SS type A sorting domain-containing protein [Aridibaculum aurantiacum]|uniref:T9SS type A sorting domain-containing protein n=1 Tax=Aridibaculum aurantiacum TaxID=2810307 RepID=UPI001A965A1B|nr:T9SS type A sorting domain-containing protein [Aridibaculum aurantiacum]